MFCSMDPRDWLRPGAEVEIEVYKVTRETSFDVEGDDSMVGWWWQRCSPDCERFRGLPQGPYTTESELKKALRLLAERKEA